MRRLAHIGPARLDAVVGPWRNVEFLFRIAIEVADQDALGAVLFVIPALERRRHTRAALADGLRQRQRARRLADALLSGAHERGAGRARHEEPDTCASMHLQTLAPESEDLRCSVSRVLPLIQWPPFPLLAIDSRCDSRALAELRFELLVVVVGDVQPGVPHFVDRTVAPA